MQWSDVTFMALCDQIPLPGSTRHFPAKNSVAEPYLLYEDPDPVLSLNPGLNLTGFYDIYMN